MPDARTRRDDLPADWTDRYLKLLGLEREAPSPDALTRLVRAHVLNVSFENVTALLRRRDHPSGPVPPPDPRTLLDAWEQKRGGGVCFELADMVTLLLTALGYRARIILAQVSIPNGHNAVVVDLESRSYLVDLGTGGPIFEAVPLDGPHELHCHGLGYRFRPSDQPGEWAQDRFIDGAWQQHARYKLGPMDAAERDAAYQHHHTPNASWVTGTLNLIHSTEDAVYTLRDATLTRYTRGGKTTETIDGLAAYRWVASELIGLPGLPIEDALAVRAEFARLATGPTNAR